MRLRRPALVLLLQMSGFLLTDFALAAGYPRFTEATCSSDAILPDWMNPAFYRVKADEIEGVDQDQVRATGDATLFQEDRIVTSPEINYNIPEKLIEAKNPVCFSTPQLRIEGASLYYRHDAWEGFIESPVYQMKIQRDSNNKDQTITVRGYGDKIIFDDKDHYRLLGCRFTTCKGDSPDWYLMADEIRIDQETMTAEATNPRIRFKDTTILALPWMDFPLDNRRRSGFLVPYVSTNNRSGISFGLPYYWNIAPNYDATLTPKISTRRGFKLDSEFRYLFEKTRGTVSFDYVPYDVVNKEDRYAFFWENRYTNVDYRIDSKILYNAVSDLEYFSDYSNRVQLMTQSTLPREVSLDYYLPDTWSTMGKVGVFVQRFQVLDPTVGSPYERMPQISLELQGEPSRMLRWSLMGQYTDFQHDYQVNGKRTVLYPSVEMPLSVHPGVTITPKVGVNMRYYSLADHPDWSKNSVSVTLPVTSVNATAIFDRDMTLWGTNYYQTLEPRLFYLYVPERNQRDIPLFDSGLMDVNFVSIFGENRYAGYDRISDANDLTFGVTSRLIDGEGGREVFSATIAQRIYFDKQRVGLPGEQLRSDKRSDMLLGVGGQVAPSVSINSLLQYSMSDAKFRQVVFGIQYHPELGKTVSIGQRYSEGQYNQLELAGQWPISRNLRAVGRYSYSFRDSRNVETLLGVEYDKDCWVFRLVGQRVQTVLGSPTTALFLQLELVGLGGIGSSPTKLLQRSVPGYQLLNDMKSTPYYERIY